MRRRKNINLLAVIFVAMLPFAFEKIALDTRPDPWPTPWFKNSYRMPEGSMICKGELSDVGFTDLQTIWPLAQEEAYKLGRRLCSTEEI